MRSFRETKKLARIAQWQSVGLRTRKAIGSIPGCVISFCSLDFAIIVEKQTSDHFYQRKTV